jgi:hypothetical protein
MATEPPKYPRQLRGTQFRLIELFVFITVFCITNALLGYFGPRGFAIRLIGSLILIAPLLPLFLLLDLIHRWNDRQLP